MPELTGPRGDVLGPVGIVQVAERAGVSPATVSRALRDRPGVSASTRQTVREAASELGYVASYNASALAQGRTNALGLLAPWMSRWFFGAIIESVYEVVSDKGYDVLLYPVGPATPPGYDPFTARGLTKRVDGVLAVNVPVRTELSGIDLSRFPIVTIGSSIDGLPGVKVDDVQVGYSATRHLLELGHTRIAFLGLDPDDVYGFEVAADRRRGYARALAEFGVIEDPRLVKTTGFAVQGGEAGLEELLEDADWDLAQLPTAVVAVSDEVAMGLLTAARQRGIRVPAELSVIGVDDHDLAYLFDLTTIGQPVRRQGQLAAELLLHSLATGVPRPAETVYLQPGLIERTTTAAPRATLPPRTCERLPVPRNALVLQSSPPSPIRPPANAGR